MTIRTASRFAALCLAPLALAACSSDEPAQEAAADDIAAAAPGGMSEDQIAAEMDKAIRPQPGQYSSSAELISLDLPGVPAAQAEQMREMMGSTIAQSTSRCLTEEEAEKGFEELAEATQDGCTMERFKVDGGEFAGRMSCDNPDAKGTIEMTGTGTQTGSDMTMKMDMTSPGLPGGKMAMTMRVKSERTGDCTG